MYFERMLDRRASVSDCEDSFGWFLDLDVNVKLASEALKKGKGTTNIYVDGCVYMLQVWFFEHFIPPEGPIEKFPRILHWMNINVGDNFVKRVMETGVVCVLLFEFFMFWSVAGLEAQLAEEKARRKTKDHGGESAPRIEPSINTGFVSPNGIDTNQPPLKTYVKVGSRKRYKGRALRTSYTGTVMLRIKNE
ncbi:hypothetical protein LR48_Vigan03g120400 [Vigna angularis]|uniref:Aminotransferase-like plant mobile domain-containing protein n=1 Tax=Phaseolus angularis TaxID=3914 RepID=A0A0L9U564_PHAAN|nr:hypothetical protein LR48_Vigan03g120400 [Vigna angularis]